MVGVLTPVISQHHEWMRTILCCNICWLYCLRDGYKVTDSFFVYLETVNRSDVMMRKEMFHESLAMFFEIKSREIDEERTIEKHRKCKNNKIKENWKTEKKEVNVKEREILMKPLKIFKDKIKLTIILGLKSKKSYFLELGKIENLWGFGREIQLGKMNTKEQKLELDTTCSF